jgi:hypothetical protein
MRTFTITFLVGFLFVSMCDAASANGRPKKHRRPARQDSARETKEVLEILRKMQAAAEEAREEARSARRQSEALAQKLDLATRELGELRQALNEQRLTGIETQIAALNTRLAAVPPAPAAPAPLPAIAPAAEARLTTLEEEVEVHKAQLKEHAQTKVESDSRFRVRLFGALIVNSYLNSTDSADADVPRIAFPSEANVGLRRNNVGTTMRQSKIGLAMTGPRLGSARLSAEAEFDFWGGPATGRTEGDVLGVLRIRTASARLDWDRTSLEVGQLAPMISPNTPNSLAAVWFPAMSSTGNLWQWRPQINVEHRARLNDSSQLVLQAGFMPNFNETFRGETLEGDPGYQGRVAFRHAMDNEQHLELGFGGYAERRNFRNGARVTNFAYTGDWNLPLTSRLSLNGEAYYGRAINLGELSGGRLDRLYATSTAIVTPATVIRGLRATGGWAQLTLAARKNLEFNFAYGLDDPNNADVRSGVITTFTRFRNTAGSANFIYNLTQNFLMSLEYRRHWTDYAPGRRTNNHYNLAFAYVF